MWCLQTINALNSAAVKHGERAAFTEVGITLANPLSLEEQLVVPPTEMDKSNMVKEVLQERLLCPFSNE